MKECLLLLLIDSARLFITPWTPASVSYITASPSLTDGHEWGEKNGCKIPLGTLGENKGGAVMDGCVWPMWGWKAEMGPFQMRQGASRAAAPRPRTPQPCQDERHLAKLPPSVLLSLVSKQIQQASRDGNTGAQPDHPLSLWQAWCQHEGSSTSQKQSQKQHRSSIRQLWGDFVPHMVIWSCTQ